MPRLLCLFFFCHPELVMGVSAQAAGCLPCGLRSLWLALPGGGKKPHWGFF